MFVAQLMDIFHLLCAFFSQILTKRCKASPRIGFGTFNGHGVNFLRRTQTPQSKTISWAASPHGLVSFYFRPLPQWSVLLLQPPYHRRSWAQIPPGALRPRPTPNIIIPPSSPTRSHFLAYTTRLTPAALKSDFINSYPSPKEP